MTHSYKILIFFHTLFPTKSRTGTTVPPHTACPVADTVAYGTAATVPAASAATGIMISPPRMHHFGHRLHAACSDATAQP